nr:Cna B-type domain-containing protein [Lentilactobacillus dabitei]
MVGIVFSSQPAKAADITSSISGIGSGDALYNGNPINQTDVSKWDQSTDYQLTYNYKIAPDTQVKTGDTATLSLPKGTHFRYDTPFDILAPDDKTVVGHVTAKAGDSSATITFTIYYSTKNNDMGGTITFSVSGSANGGGTAGGDYITKNGWAFKGDYSNGKTYPLDGNGRYQYVEWDGKINPNNRSLNTAVITDNIQNPDSQTMVPGTLLVQWDDGKNTPVPVGDYTVNYLPNATAPTSFTIKWNGTLTKTVNVFYLTKINPESDYTKAGAHIGLNNQMTVSGYDTGSGGGTKGNIDVVDTGTANALVTLGAGGNGNGSTYSVGVKKQWNDVPAGVNEPAIQVELYRQTSTDKEPQVTGKTVTLSSPTWSGTFDALSKDDGAGKAITYSVKEVKVPDSFKETGGTVDSTTQTATLVNTYNSPTPPATTSIKINKVWRGVPDGVTPPSVTAYVYKNGDTKNPVKTVTLDQAHNYTAEVSGLPKQGSDGKDITYTVAEDTNTLDKDTYESKTPGQQSVKNNVVTLTNAYIPKTTSITVKKQWKGVPSGTTLPDQITATLYANKVSTGKMVTLNAGNNWSAPFPDLPETDGNGNTIKYTVAETAVPTGYLPKTSGLQNVMNGKVTLTNDFIPHKTSVTVNKVWEGVPKGTQLPDVVVTLWENGKATNQTRKLTSANGYLSRFDNLPLTDENGQSIKYEVVETPVAGYQSRTNMRQEVKDGKVTFINAFIPKQSTITVKKVWKNVSDGVTTPSVTATLYANGESTGKTVILDNLNNYIASFGDLPETDSAGNTIVYTVVEDNVPDGYKADPSGPRPVNNGAATLTNEYVPNTPVTPDTPVTPTPVTPDTPTPKKPTSDVPKTTRKTPDRKVPNKSTATTTQHAKVTAKRPTLTTSANGQTPSPTTGVPTNSLNKLPQTNDNEKQELLITAMGIILMSLLGIAEVITHKIGMK